MHVRSGSPAVQIRPGPVGDFLESRRAWSSLLTFSLKTGSGQMASMSMARKKCPRGIGLGLPVAREQFAFRTDDLMAHWQAVRAGVGIGFVADYVARTDADVIAALPLLKIPALPVWLAVHREIRTSKRIRAVYDFLSDNIPHVL